jgi:hypothetical protein
MRIKAISKQRISLQFFFRVSKLMLYENAAHFLSPHEVLVTVSIVLVYTSTRRQQCVMVIVAHKMASSVLIV